jgi:L-ascorbate metabolism protein UlaG (beta-lactamase superfamily)
VKTTLDWLGVATWRLTVGDTVIFLDAYMDRVPGAPPVGLSAREVDRADAILVGHSHFDHIAGAEVIAKNTGARIIGSHESCRVMREAGVPDTQLLPTSGGERHRIADGITVRAFPSIHSCTWILTDVGSGEAETGHAGLTQDERAACPGLVQRIMSFAASGAPEGAVILDHVRSVTGSTSDGGGLVYLVETPDARIFFQDTSGCWGGVLDSIDAEIAILAAAGRANVDGEPIQGSMAQFIAMEAKLLGSRIVFLGHHDNWMPPITNADFDMAPVREEMAREVPGVGLAEVGYLEGTLLVE